MSDRSASRTCLNCGEVLDGRFCSRCGQRAIGAYPTITEMVGDAWQELSGWDGRFARTLRTLVRRPGALTVETMEGRRARYVSPVRLYLLASLVYFLCAAAIPNLEVRQAAVTPGSGVVIRVDGSGTMAGFTDEEREKALKDLERAPWWAKAILRPILLDPAGFQSRFIQTLPRVLFALVPVFAAIVALFYRRRPFPQHLIFAVHLHAAIFLALTIRELSQLARSVALLRVFEFGVVIAITLYGLIAFRTVYAESWGRVVGKALGIAVIYAVAGIIALLLTTIWSVITAWS